MNLNPPVDIKLAWSDRAMQPTDTNATVTPGAGAQATTLVYTCPAGRYAWLQFGCLTVTPLAAGSGADVGRAALQVSRSGGAWRSVAGWQCAATEAASRRVLAAPFMVLLGPGDRLQLYGDSLGAISFQVDLYCTVMDYQAV